jgi:hypothetical protein
VRRAEPVPEIENLFRAVISVPKAAIDKEEAQLN